MSRTQVLIAVAAVLIAGLRLYLRYSPQADGAPWKWIRKIQEALRTSQPSGSNPYWRALPLRRSASLLTGAFLLSAAGGFVVNLIFSNRLRLFHGLFWPPLIAFVSTLTLIVRLKRPRWIFLTSLFGLGMFLLMLRDQLVMPQTLGTSIGYRELVFNAVGIALSVALGTRFIMSFLTTEGVASVRMQTELTLAQGIQSTLVPAISLTTERFEVFGISLPSAEVGGDLVDVIESDGSLLAYVADISGHGLPAGQLMGMLKTAMRALRDVGVKPVGLMEGADRVLPGLKDPEMYATLAVLHFDASREVEYSLAGHPPILHYRKNGGDIAELAMQQFPIALLGNTQYASARAPYAAGDLFVILTDGILEVANDAEGELGLEKVSSLVRSYATGSLSKLWEAIHLAAGQHGRQIDDQSVLMVRVL